MLSKSGTKKYWRWYVSFLNQEYSLLSKLEKGYTMSKRESVSKGIYNTQDAVTMIQRNIEILNDWVENLKQRDSSNIFPNAIHEEDQVSLRKIGKTRYKSTQNSHRLKSPSQHKKSQVICNTKKCLTKECEENFKSGIRKDPDRTLKHSASVSPIFDPKIFFSSVKKREREKATSRKKDDCNQVPTAQNQKPDSNIISKMSSKLKFKTGFNIKTDISKFPSVFHKKKDKASVDSTNFLKFNTNNKKTRLTRKGKLKHNSVDKLLCTEKIASKRRSVISNLTSLKSKVVTLNGVGTKKQGRKLILNNQTCSNDPSHSHNTSNVTDCR